MIFWIIDLIISLVFALDAMTDEPFMRALLPDPYFAIFMIIIWIDVIWAFCAIIIKIIKKARKKSKLARQQQEIGK